MSIPVAEPEVSGREWEYVKDCLDSGWLSSVGDYVNRFERDLASLVGAEHAVATSSGTAALHVALLAAGIGPGDEVLVSDLTFVASANAVRYVGAFPILVDSEPRYLQMDVHKVEEFLRLECKVKQGRLYNKASRRRVKAIMPVHILGHPVDVDPLVSLANEYSLCMIEDATEGLGARYKGRPLGNLGEIGCFSFNGNKIITTGGGGMLVTNDATFADRARHLTTQAKSDPLEYIHDEVGYNYRLNNIQAAVGCAQLERLNEFIDAKKGIARRYGEAFAGMPGVCLPEEAVYASSTWWLYTVLIDPDVCGVSSRELLAALLEKGIQSRPMWQPLHMSPVYRSCQATDCSVTERVYETALSLPCSVGLCDRQDLVIRAVSEVFAAV